MTVPDWLRAIGRMLIDPVEQNICLVRLGGLVALVPWAVGAWRTATTLHPHLRPLGESGGGLIAALGAALSAKRWAQGNPGRRNGPPGTDVEDHP